MQAIATCLLCVVLTACAATVSRRETSLASLESVVQQQAATIERLQSRLDEVETKVNVQGRGVSFRASFLQDGKSHVIHFSKTEPLKFDLLAENYGGAFSKSTGKFTAPYRGIYGFHLHIMASSEGSVMMSIHSTSLTGSGLACDVYAEDHNIDSNDQSTCTTVLELNKGDEVYVLWADDVPALWSGFTAFVGVLIQPLY